jgi:hypothetical protein
MDLGVNPGDLVGVVQKKDPMGNAKRWFVDNGLKQGFVPAHVLNEIDAVPYDDVIPVEAAVVETTPATVAEDNIDVDSKKQLPVRKAPAPPAQPPQTTPEKAACHHSDQQSNHSYEEIAASEAASEVSNL